MPEQIVTDYLVVGAGTAGMVFTDELLAHTDATVTIVDRRHAPGGHWIDAYPFVRLHQPSAFYGVTSMPLGADAVDEVGTNAGFYELADPDEIRTYFSRVMTRRFLPTGRVRYFPNCDYVGDHRFESRLGDASWQVRVERKLIDTTYLEGTIPATSPPPFEVADGVRCVPAGDIVRIDDRPERYVIIGGGKTAFDTVVWLLERGTPASAITWVKPREVWCLNRRFQQPYTMVPELYRGIALQFELIASATSVDDLFQRMEAESYFLRVDPEVETTMFRGAIISERELELLRRVRDVVRLGHVQRIERDQIVLDRGTVPTDERTVHVHCASRGLARPPLRPIFEADRVTVQPFMWAFASYQFGALAVAEATIGSDEEKNRLCRPISYWDANRDFVTAWAASMAFEGARANYPPLARWVRTTRLNPASGVAAYREDPRVTEARGRIKRFAPAAVANLQNLLA